MEVCIAPISGSLFPAQSAALWKLTEQGKELWNPRLCFSGSGGGVALMTAISANWIPSKIFAVSSAISSECFISQWTTSKMKILPSFTNGLIHGSFYNTTRKGESLLRNHVTEESVQEVELWIAATNEVTGNVLLTTNMSRDRALIRGENLDTKLFEYEGLSYTSGDIELISKAILASACIPIMVKPVQIGDQTYIDCGVKYGSSLTPMFREVLSIARKQGVHITYILGCDLTHNPIKKKTTVGLFDHIELSASHATRSHMEYDRNMAHMIIMEDCDDEPWYREFSVEEINTVLTQRKSARRSLMEIYPTKTLYLDLTKFTGEELCSRIEEYGDLLRIRIWWSGDPKIF